MVAKHLRSHHRQTTPGTMTSSLWTSQKRGTLGRLLSVACHNPPVLRLYLLAICGTLLTHCSCMVEKPLAHRRRYLLRHSHYGNTPSHHPPGSNIIIQQPPAALTAIPEARLCKMSQREPVSLSLSWDEATTSEVIRILILPLDGPNGFRVSTSSP